MLRNISAKKRWRSTDLTSVEAQCIFAATEQSTQQEEQPLDTSATGGLPETRPDGTAGLTRPSRALIGWMLPAQAEMVLGGNMIGKETSTQHRELARSAREAVASRPIGIDQTDITSDPPPELEEHISQLRQSSAGAAMFQQGCDVVLVDLTRVCAFQPTVVADAAIERVQDVKADDLAAIAAITLPTRAAEPPRIQFDQSRQLYMVASPDLNLQIVGYVSGPAPDGSGAVALGFTVMAAPSFLNVVRFQDRVLLRDGYHRAYGFLNHGITHVPAFIRTMEAIEDVIPPGTFLPQHSYLGDRPPVLPDYLDDRVASTVRLPAVQKMVVIQGIQMTPGA
ncbi:MAG TPA: hypothetical protein VN969_42655 [Streptosporangiaceae bacterium]|nr:hypothetical protein [Streptosporangiaceae bacterium]